MFPCLFNTVAPQVFIAFWQKRRTFQIPYANAFYLSHFPWLYSQSHTRTHKPFGMFHAKGKQKKKKKKNPYKAVYGHQKRGKKCHVALLHWQNEIILWLATKKRCMITWHDLSIDSIMYMEKTLTWCHVSNEVRECVTYDVGEALDTVAFFYFYF